MNIVCLSFVPAVAVNNESDMAFYSLKNNEIIRCLATHHINFQSLRSHEHVAIPIQRAHWFKQYHSHEYF